jgi:hypothetical protein
MKFNLIAFLALVAAVLLVSVDGREIEENTKVTVVQLNGNGKNLLLCQLIVLNMRHFLTSAICGQFAQSLVGSPNSIGITPMSPQSEQPAPFQGNPELN